MSICFLNSMPPKENSSILDTDLSDARITRFDDKDLTVYELAKQGFPVDDLIQMYYEKIISISRKYTEIVALKEVVYDIKARNGDYCNFPYKDNAIKKYNGEKTLGCPNFPRCIEQRKDFKLNQDSYTWFAIIEEFNLKEHAKSLKNKNPLWTEKQCYCLLYWQNGVRNRLKKKSEIFAEHFNDTIILDIPEAHGINVFETLAKADVIIDKSNNPDIVKKVMFVGIKKEN